MSRSLFRARRAPLAASALALAAPLAHAQSFPNHPIRLMVGYAAGGGVDAAARLVAQRLGSVLGQQVLVENKSGASGMIAAEYVAKAPADGYTLLMGETGMLITSQLQPRANFDPIKGGKVRAIALMNTGKLPGAENIPSMADALPGFDVAPRLMVMVMAPAGTPQAVVDRLNDAMRSVMTSAESRKPPRRGGFTAS